MAHNGQSRVYGNQVQKGLFQELYTYNPLQTNKQ